jgi:hypothetical protein
MNDPWRNLLLTRHREGIKKSSELLGSTNTFLTTTTVHLTKQQLTNLIGLKEIFLSDMDTTKDHIYERHIIQLTSIV